MFAKKKSCVKEGISVIDLSISTKKKCLSKTNEGIPVIDLSVSTSSDTKKVVSKIEEACKN
jgi:hypothetical protein